jgi:hypothetical protein
MNPLFLGLVIAGVVLVIGVLAYNWLQERRVRRRTAAAFTRPGGREHTEPSLRGGDAVGGARSVAIDTAAADADADDELPGEDALPHAGLPQPLGVAHGARDSAAPDPDIECVVLLQPAVPAQSTALGPTLARQHPKPVRWLGRRAAGLPWQVLDAAPGPWPEIAACLLLADRSGAATRADIEGFLHAVADAAAQLACTCALPDAGDEAGRAEELDRFCADLDVQIGLTILKPDLGQIAGTRLRGVAEAAGFRLDPAGQFDYVDETGNLLWRLQNYRPEPFTLESLRALTTPGVVLLIDVPRVADPVRVFDQMRLIAKRLAQNLEGVLVDDNRRPLDDAALAAIRDQVQATVAGLRAAHIEPGGTRALRLFG